MFFQTNTTCGDNEYVTDKIMLIMLQNKSSESAISIMKKKHHFM